MKMVEHYPQVRVSSLLYFFIIWFKSLENSSVGVFTSILILVSGNCFRIYKKN